MSINNLNLHINKSAYAGVSLKKKEEIVEEVVEDSTLNEYTEQLTDLFMEEYEPPAPAPTPPRPRRKAVVREATHEVIDRPTDDYHHGGLTEIPKSYIESSADAMASYIADREGPVLKEYSDPVDHRFNIIERQLTQLNRLREDLGGMGGRNLVSGIGQGGDGQTPGGGAVWFWDLNDIDIGTPLNGVYPAIPDNSVMLFNATVKKWVVAQTVPSATSTTQTVLLVMDPDGVKGRSPTLTGSSNTRLPQVTDVDNFTTQQDYNLWLLDAIDGEKDGKYYLSTLSGSTFCQDVGTRGSDVSGNVTIIQGTTNTDTGKLILKTNSEGFVEFRPNTRTLHINGTGTQATTPPTPGTANLKITAVDGSPKTIANIFDEVVKLSAPLVIETELMSGFSFQSAAASFVVKGKSTSGAHKLVSFTNSNEDQIFLATNYGSSFGRHVHVVRAPQDATGNAARAYGFSIKGRTVSAPTNVKGNLLETSYSPNEGEDSIRYYGFIDNPNDIATKQYVDDNSSGSDDTPTFTNGLYLDGDTNNRFIISSGAGKTLQLGVGGTEGSTSGTTLLQAMNAAEGIYFYKSVNIQNGGLTAAGAITAQSLQPSSNDTYNIGSSVSIYKDVWAKNHYANAGKFEGYGMGTNAVFRVRDGTSTKFSVDAAGAMTVAGTMSVVGDSSLYNTSIKAGKTLTIGRDSSGDDNGLQVIGLINGVDAKMLYNHGATVDSSLRYNGAIVNELDMVNKKYVDDSVSGVDVTQWTSFFSAATFSDPPWPSNLQLMVYRLVGDYEVQVRIVITQGGAEFLSSSHSSSQTIGTLPSVARPTYPVGFMASADKTDAQGQNFSGHVYSDGVIRVYPAISGSGATQLSANFSFAIG